MLCARILLDIIFGKILKILSSKVYVLRFHLKIITKKIKKLIN